MSNSASGNLIRSLLELRGLPCNHAGYWDRLAEALQTLCRGLAVSIIEQLVDQAADARTVLPGWLLLGQSSRVDLDPPAALGWAEELPPLVARASSQGFAMSPARLPSGEEVWRCVVRLARRHGAFALLSIPERERQHLNELMLRAMLVADIPGDDPAANAGEVTAPGKPDAGPEVPTASASGASSSTEEPGLGLVAALDIVAQVSQAENFGSAALAIVNGLAAQHSATQVVLGWREDASMQAVAISHLDRFDRRSHQLQVVEDALDEVLDHEGPLRLDDQTPDEPLPAHEQLREATGLRQWASFSLRGTEAMPTGALLMGFTDKAPDKLVLQQIRLAIELVLPWLASLHARERPWVLRWRDAARQSLRDLVGPRHAGLKLAAAALSMCLMYSLLGHWDYRIQATGQLSTDNTRIVSAQFDSRVEEAIVNAGDLVQEGDVLATLDTRDLRQQQLDAGAELRRYVAETDKARANGALGEQEISAARVAQAEIRLNRLVEQIELAVMRAPFSGVVVDGDRKDLQGAPVRRGDKLYRVARIEALYVVVQVPERDAALLRLQAGGELVLVARPEQAIPLRVASVIPVAQTRGQEGNQFLVRAELSQAPQDWWRPGMSGAVRIDAGERQVAWILVHRLVDAIRLALWF